jgi:hypothetical protein
MGTKSKVKMKIDRVKSSITKHLWLNETPRLGKDGMLKNTTQLVIVY